MLIKFFFILFTNYRRGAKGFVTLILMLGIIYGFTNFVDTNILVYRFLVGTLDPTQVGNFLKQ